MKVWDYEESTLGQIKLGQPRSQWSRTNEAEPLSQKMAKVIWRNRDQLSFAWRILTRGVCDGCALGTSGVRDFTIDGVYLCMVRLDLMRLNTMPALDVRRLADAQAKTAIFVWSMGITQHQDGVSNVRDIIDLALSRGFMC